MQPFSNKQ